MKNKVRKVWSFIRGFVKYSHKEYERRGTEEYFYSKLNGGYQKHPYLTNKEVFQQRLKDKI